MFAIYTQIKKYTYNSVCFFVFLRIFSLYFFHSFLSSNVFNSNRLKQCCNSVFSLIKFNGKSVCKLFSSTVYFGGDYFSFSFKEKFKDNKIQFYWALHQKVEHTWKSSKILILFLRLCPVVNELFGASMWQSTDR